MQSTHSPGRQSLGESFLDVPRRTPPRPASVGSPGRIADLSSIRRDPYEGELIHLPFTSYANFQAFQFSS